MTTKPPYRLTEQCFRDYEKTIAYCVQILPSPVNLHPAPGRSQNTLEARLRDAMRTLHEMRWSPTEVNMVKFDEYYEKIQVTRNGDEVIVRLRGAGASQVRAENNVSSGLVVTADKASERVIRAVYELCNAGIVHGVQIDVKRSMMPDSAGLDVAIVDKGESCVVI